ncbi:MAG: hypothetical protein GX335_00025 [Firmicutes bacterium]|nr:hypothetical protein [Bacillota bacterium]
MCRKLALLIFIVVFLSGCAGYERVKVPPKIGLEGAEKIAILFFDNYTADSALPRQLEQELKHKLARQFQILEPAETAWALSRLGLSRGDLPNFKQAVRLGKLLEVDALLVGEVTSYFAPIRQSAPYISKTRVLDDDSREYQWEISQTTIVMVGFTGRVISGRTGNVIHLDRAEGEATKVRREFLGRRWYPEGKEPDQFFLPRVSERDLFEVRASALKQAVDQFTADLLPTWAWRKTDQ